MTSESKTAPTGFNEWWQSHTISPENPETMDDRSFAVAVWNAAIAANPPAGLPMVPTREIVRVLAARHSFENGDHERGRIFGRAEGRNIVPPVFEDELAAGLYLRLVETCGNPQPAADVLRIDQPGHRLDPIIVYFEDMAPGRGRITIACYGDAWTGAWGAMGKRTVRQFVAGVDPGYLSGSLLELRKASNSFRGYTERVAAAVIAALNAPPVDAATDAVEFEGYLERFTQ